MVKPIVEQGYEPWKQLHSYLSGGRLADEEVSELVDAAVSVSREGWPVKVFPKGIPYPDGVVLHAVIERDRIENLLRLILEHPRLDGVKVFPRGIPVPDVFTAEIELR
jgi:hypothetical protein